jgi:CRP-like cAMP-binding protein
VLAVGEVEVYVMGRAVFQRLLSAHPELAEDVSAVLATRQTELEQVKLSREARQQRVAERSSQILTQIRKIFSLG